MSMLHCSTEVCQHILSFLGCSHQHGTQDWVLHLEISLILLDLQPLSVSVEAAAVHDLDQDHTVQVSLTAIPD